MFHYLFSRYTQSSISVSVKFRLSYILVHCFNAFLTSIYISFCVSLTVVFLHNVRICTLRFIFVCVSSRLSLSTYLSSHSISFNLSFFTFYLFLRIFLHILSLSTYLSSHSICFYVSFFIFYLFLRIFLRVLSVSLYL